MKNKRLKQQLLNELAAIRNNLLRVEALIGCNGPLPQIQDIFEAIQNDAHGAMNACDKELSR